MKIFDFNKATGATHEGCRGWMGTNPNIETVYPIHADFFYYSAWGDGDSICLDMARLFELARRCGKPCIFVLTGDHCYVPEKDDGNFYFTTHLHSNAGTPGAAKQWQVPYSYESMIHPHLTTYPDAVLRDILASFRGSMDTNPKRRRLREIASPRIIIEEADGWTAAGNNPESWARHRELLDRSFFTLCPRGIGPSSIRLIEAIFRGSVPVMLDDNSRLFGDPMDFAIRHSLDDVATLPQVLQDDLASDVFRSGPMSEWLTKYLLADSFAGCTGTIGYTEFIRQKVTQP